MGEMRIFECHKCGEVWGAREPYKYEHKCEEERSDGAEAILRSDRMKEQAMDED